MFRFWTPPPSSAFGSDINTVLNPRNLPYFVFYWAKPPLHVDVICGWSLITKRLARATGIVGTRRKRERRRERGSEAEMGENFFKSRLGCLLRGAAWLGFKDERTRSKHSSCRNLGPSLSPSLPLSFVRSLHPPMPFLSPQLPMIHVDVPTHELERNGPRAGKRGRKGLC